VILIASPALNISGDHPERMSTVAPRISQRMCVTVPSAARTSKCNHECGFHELDARDHALKRDVFIEIEIRDAVVRVRGARYAHAEWNREARRAEAPASLFFDTDRHRPPP
jgi:hypothetical protein